MTALQHHVAFGTLLQCREIMHLFHAVWLESALMLALCLA